MIRAAEAALAHHKFVSAIDVFTGMGLLEPSRLADWRMGRIDYLESVIHTNLKKISLRMAEFRRWAQRRGLRPGETCYRHRSHHLRFSRGGTPSIEKAYRTRFVSPDLAGSRPAAGPRNLSSAEASPSVDTSPSDSPR